MEIWVQNHHIAWYHWIYISKEKQDHVAWMNVQTNVCKHMHQNIWSQKLADFVKLLLQPKPQQKEEKKWKAFLNVLWHISTNLWNRILFQSWVLKTEILSRCPSFSVKIMLLWHNISNHTWNRILFQSWALKSEILCRCPSFGGNIIEYAL